MLKTIALAVVVSFVTSSCTSVQATDSYNADLAPFAMGASEFPFGDSIVISEVHCSTEEVTKGTVLTVRGTYDLVSRESATLYLGTTTSESSCANETTHTALVAKGAGSFELTHTVPGAGHPHITFYDRDTGKPFGGSYFGKGASVLAGGPLGYDR